MSDEMGGYSPDSFAFSALCGYGVDGDDGISMP